MTAAMRVIKQFADGSYFAYGAGNFDDFQVGYYDGQQHRQALREVAILARLQYLADRYSANVVWHFADIIFTLVSDNARRRGHAPVPDPADFNVIARLAGYFANPPSDPAVQVTNVEKVLVYVYLTMISECHRPHTRLYHRLKRLAIYQVVCLHMPPATAANFARGKSFRALQAVLAQYGL